jgi:ribonuclease R
MKSFKKSRTDIRDTKMCFSIDSKGARAIDDVISVENFSDEMWKIGIHIADVADFVAQNKPIDKAA